MNKISEPLTTLDEVAQALYNRAIADPSSLTDRERRIITHRPPPEEEDALCRTACGQSMTELVTKAIQNGDSLTWKEAHLLSAGVVPNQAGRLLSERVRMSKTDRDLTHRAAAAATTEEMEVAQGNARAVLTRFHAAKGEALKFLKDSDMQNIKYAMTVPWQEHVLGLAETTVCGLVIFISDVLDGASFKGQIEAAMYHGFNCYPNLTNKAAVAKFTLYWVEDNDPRALRDCFTSMRDAISFPTGLRSDAFLYVDEGAMRSRDTARPFVWLWEPNETAVPLKVDIKHIAPALFARLTQRDLATEKARKWPYRDTPELQHLHRAANRSSNTEGELDGIWPPAHRLM